jgi:hypothetical protein
LDPFVPITTVLLNRIVGGIEDGDATEDGHPATA